MAPNNVVHFSPKKPNGKRPKTQVEKDRALRIKVLVVLGLFIIYVLVERIYFYDSKELKKSDNYSYSTLDGEKIVEAKMSTNGHYVVDGKINGFDVIFLVDTGASFVAIPESVANEIGLTKGKEFTASTAGGETKSYITNLDSLSVGKIKKTNLFAHIVPEMDRRHILLGNNFLYDLSVEQKDRKLIIKQ